MTAEIVNLNKVRKARARAEREQRAQENTLKFGRTKADRQLGETRLRQAKDKLDGARRDQPNAGDSDDPPDAS